MSAQYVNVRRFVANKVQTTVRPQKTETFGNDKRKALLNQLSLADLKELEIYRTNADLTDADTYIVFKLRTSEKYARIALENDFAIPLICEGIETLSTSYNDFFLPTNPVNWLVYDPFCYPDFQEWCVAGCRFPILKEDKKTITHGNGSQIPSRMDILEVYISAFHYTLMEFYDTNDAKYINFAWKILRTMKKVIKNFETTTMPTENQIADLHEAIEKRESSIEWGIRYRELVGKMHPAQYFSIMYTLMVKHPETMLRTRMINPEVLFWGFLTQDLLPRKTNAQALSRSFLRLYLERGLRVIKVTQNPQCQTKEELVKMLLNVIPVRVQKVLKYASLGLESLKIAEIPLGLVGFIRSIKSVHDTITKMDGILPFCNIIDPSNTLTDENIAEIFLSACQKKEKYSVLHVKALESNSTEHLDEVIAKVNKQIEDVQKQIDAIKLKEPDEKEEELFIDPQELYDIHVSPVFAKYRFNTRSLNAIAGLVLSYARDGKAEHIPVLEGLCTIVCNKGILSRRRMTTLICWSTDIGSPIHNYFCPVSGKTSRACGKKWMGRFLWKAGRVPIVQKPVVRKYIPEEEDEKDEFVKWVPVAVARMTAQGVVKVITELVAEQEVECIICLEDCKKLVMLHNNDMGVPDNRHVICVPCRDELFRKNEKVPCPFCRKECKVY